MAAWKLNEEDFNIDRSALRAALGVPVWEGAANEDIDETLVDAMRSAQRLHPRLGALLPLDPSSLPMYDPSKAKGLEKAFSRLTMGELQESTGMSPTQAAQAMAGDGPQPLNLPGLTGPASAPRGWTPKPAEANDLYELRQCLMSIAQRCDMAGTSSTRKPQCVPSPRCRAVAQCAADSWCRTSAIRRAASTCEYWRSASSSMASRSS